MQNERRDEELFLWTATHSPHRPSSVGAIISRKVWFTASTPTTSRSVTLNVNILRKQCHDLGVFVVSNFNQRQPFWVFLGESWVWMRACYNKWSNKWSLITNLQKQATECQKQKTKNGIPVWKLPLSSCKAHFCSGPHVVICSLAVATVPEKEEEDSAPCASSSRLLVPETMVVAAPRKSESPLEGLLRVSTSSKLGTQGQTTWKNSRILFQFQFCAFHTFSVSPLCFSVERRFLGLD